MSKQQKLTPLMEQYFSIKKQYQEEILLFQVGDFYELFFDDAITAANFLAITLTKRGKVNGQDVPLCGFPLHAALHYITKLVKGGFKVALCDQVTKPQPGTVVERAVTKVYTPGTLTDAALLDEKTPSYLAVIAPDMKTGAVALVVTELLTGQLIGTLIGPDGDYDAELARFSPDEILLCASAPDKSVQQLEKYLKSRGYVVACRPDKQETSQGAQWVATLSDTSLEPLLKTALISLHAYIQHAQPSALHQYSHITLYQPAAYVQLDRSTIHNLELLTTVDGEAGRHAATVYNAIDKTVTAMGARLLKKWLLRPLTDHSMITARYDAVAALLSNSITLETIRHWYKQIADVERIAGRMSLLRASIADYRALRDTLPAVRELQKTIGTLLKTGAGTTHISHSDLLNQTIHSIADFTPLEELLHKSINDDTTNYPNFLLKTGYNSELDELRSLAFDGKSAITALAQEQAEKLAIPNLKILYTSVAGYFFEVTQTHVAKVPDHFEQIQKLANRSRYTTAQLKQLEYRVSAAQEQCGLFEKQLYAELEVALAQWLSPLRALGNALATIDVLQSFALQAHHHQYSRPVIAQRVSGEQAAAVYITAGRHPVVEQKVENGAFTPNDTVLDEHRLIIMTGPNMGGKSTYLRQVALICLLAQCGSFVPAATAQLPLVDRVFTRIGAGDNVAQGKSTFLIEMEETATICSQATAHSLIILDEVGRGTSTHDGRALAHAIIEYLVALVGAHTLFATHYHELTALAAQNRRIANYHMSCSKRGGTLLFHHAVKKGPSGASFGIDVARLAKVPQPIITRARELIRLQHYGDTPTDHPGQYSVFSRDHADEQEQRNSCAGICERIGALRPDELTARQALDLLWELCDEKKSGKSD